MPEISSKSSVSGAEKVRQFFDSLASGEVPNEQEFGRLNLNDLDASARRDNPTAGKFVHYDLLLEIARQLLESELEEALFQYQRMGINKKEYTALCASF
jgi:hypothetical protein